MPFERYSFPSRTGKALRKKQIFLFFKLARNLKAQPFTQLFENIFNCVKTLPFHSVVKMFWLIYIFFRNNCPKGLSKIIVDKRRKWRTDWGTNRPQNFPPGPINLFDKTTKIFFEQILILKKSFYDPTYFVTKIFSQNFFQTKFFSTTIFWSSFLL